MFRNEGAVDHDILAASAGETGDVPVVVDAIVFTGQKKRAEVRQLTPLNLDTAGHRSQVDPGAMVAAAGKRPAATYTIAAGGALGLPGRRIGRRVHHGGICRPIPPAGSPWGRGRFAGMHADDSRDPPGASLGARDFHDRAVKFPWMDLAAAPSSGLQATHDAGFDQVLPGIVGQAAQFRRCGGAFAQGGRQRFRAFDQARPERTAGAVFARTSDVLLMGLPPSGCTARLDADERAPDRQNSQRRLLPKARASLTLPEWARLPQRRVGTARKAV